MTERTQIELTLILFVVTEKAVMVGREDTDELDEIWLPKRAIDFESGYIPEAGDEDVVVLMPEALAVKKGLL